MSAETNAPAVELITVNIDGIDVQVPKGTLAIRAAESIGIDIPRFCDHPLLDPMGACRQCMVEVPDAGNGRGFPMPQAACTLTTAPGMQIKTQYTSEMAKAAQAGVQELILINHPLDCPICDKAGECPLQNQAFANGRTTTRYDGVKRTYPKPLPLSAQILLDRERCVLCARCTRFSEQISGDPLIALTERGATQQVGVFGPEPYDSYFSGNVAQICPVGALTAASYRFNSRPFDLVSTDVTCEHCAAGCQLRTDHRHFQVRRRLAGNAPEINEEWNCDKGRFAFMSGVADRIDRPLIRENGLLRPASWPEAIDVAVAGLKAANGSVGVLTGGRLTTENAYAYSKFARLVLGTNDIDYRSRPASAEETGFLAAKVAGKAFGTGVSYTDLENAKQVVLVCFEPEDESPMVFLRLRKAVRKHGLKVVTIAALSSRGSVKLNAELLATAPGQETEALRGLELDPDAIILVGERAASVPGLLSAVARTQARWAWIPRRAGELGALNAGCLPNLLPGGRPLAEPKARIQVCGAWRTEVPPEVGRSADELLADPPKAWLLGGLEARDFADYARVDQALGDADFVVSLETRLSDVHKHANVIFPVALLEEQSGHFTNWEHRVGQVNKVNSSATQVMTDLRVLAALADALGQPLGFRSPEQAWAELNQLGSWEKARPELTAVEPSDASAPSSLDYRLSTWRQLLDESWALDGAEELQATARKQVLKLSPATAERLGVACGDELTVRGPGGELRLPVTLAKDLADDTVWLPSGAAVSVGELGVTHGGLVALSRGGAE